MPYIICDLKEGLSADQKQRLADAIVDITHRMIGSPIPYIHVSVRDNSVDGFVESGARNRTYGVPKAIAA